MTSAGDQRVADLDGSLVLEREVDDQALNHPRVERLRVEPAPGAQDERFRVVVWIIEGVCHGRSFSEVVTRAIRRKKRSVFVSALIAHPGFVPRCG